MDDRLRRAEERIAHLERMAEELSDVIHRQERGIAQLARRVEALVALEAERQAEAGAEAPPASQRPPHW